MDGKKVLSALGRLFRGGQGPADQRGPSEEWQTATDPERMLRALEGRASARKRALFQTACCRQAWHLLPHEKSRQVVEVMERGADSLVARQEVSTARHAWHWLDLEREELGAKHPVFLAELAVHDAGPEEASRLVREALGPAAALEQAALLRCLFGDPFRPAPPPAPSVLAWEGGTVVRLAEEVYAERAFDRLPVLGDALEEAGWDNALGLSHCRGPGPHARGCWVVDLVLGRP